MYLFIRIAFCDYKYMISWMCIHIYTYTYIYTYIITYGILHSHIDDIAQDWGNSIDCIYKHFIVYSAYHTPFSCLCFRCHFSVTSTTDSMCLHVIIFKYKIYSCSKLQYWNWCFDNCRGIYDNVIYGPLSREPPWLPDPVLGQIKY